MPRNARYLLLSLVLVFTPETRAEVKIPHVCRIRNRPPGRCGWCAVETLARCHHIKVLYGLAEENVSPCSPGDLEEFLTAIGVAYRIQYPGHRDQKILRDAVKGSLGAAIGFRELYPGVGGHIVTLVDIDEDSVQVIDSNDQDGRIRHMSLERFLYWWDGFALVLQPPERQKKQPSPTPSALSARTEKKVPSPASAH